MMRWKLQGDLPHCLVVEMVPHPESKEKQGVKDWLVVCVCEGGMCRCVSVGQRVC